MFLIKVIIATSKTFKNRKFCRLSHDVRVKRLFSVIWLLNAKKTGVKTVGIGLHFKFARIMTSFP